MNVLFEKVIVDPKEQGKAKQAVAAREDGATMLLFQLDGDRATVLLPPQEAIRLGVALIQCATLANAGAAAKAGVPGAIPLSSEASTPKSPLV